MSQNNRAFTLIEFLVVVFIIVLLTSILLPNYELRKKELALERSANLLAQFIRKAIEKTMGAEEYRGIIPPGGYGVYLKKDGENYQIFIFADCNNDKLWTDEGFTPCNGFEEKVADEEVRLEEGVKIENLSPHISPGESLHLIFKPPDPTIYFNDNDPSLEALIILSLSSDPTKKKQVSVNRAGLIYLQDVP